MATAALLPAALESKLDELATRIRRLRLLRGLGLLLVALLVTAGMAMAADAYFHFGRPMRGVLLAGWTSFGLVAAWFTLVKPQQQPLDRASLAAAVEEAYPKLGERLTTAVELSGGSDDHHGSRNLIALLVRETELKARAMDFGRVMPAHAAEYAGVAATVTVLLFLAPAVFFTDAYLSAGQRFLNPFTANVAAFSIAVEPGDTTVARGRPLEFEATLSHAAEGAKLPERATLVLLPEGKKPIKLRMNDAGDHTFRFRLDDVQSRVQYRVEAGDASTVTHTITAVDPVALANGSPAITVTPPGYCRPTFDVLNLQGPQDVQAMHGSRIVWEWQFDRPAQEAYLLIASSDDGQAPRLSSEASKLKLTLSADGRSARHELLGLPQRDAMKLVLIGEAGIVTETPASLLTVSLDQPPAFARVAGMTSEPRKVGVSDKVPVDCTVTDDVGIAEVALEYRVNEGEPKTEVIPLTEKGRSSVDVKHALKLKGKAKDGDTIKYRLVARDARQVPELGLEPNVSYYPSSTRWAELKVVGSAQPLKQQEIAANELNIEKRLKAIIDEVDRERRMQTIAKNSPDKPEQDKALANLRELHKHTTDDIDHLSRDAGQLPGYAPIAEGLQAVNEGAMRKAGEGIASAQTKLNVARKETVMAVDADLLEARHKLEALLRDSPKIAQARADQAKLEALADKQNDLADKAEKVESKDEQARLKQEERDLAEEVKRLAEQSPELKQALQQATAAMAEKLADDAQKLADEQKALNEAMQKQDQSERAGKLADLAKEQAELAQEAKKLADETKTDAKVAQGAPLRPEMAEKAAESLKQGDAPLAQKQQEQMARDLDKLSDRLQKALELARDPREAAAQLARKQEANRQNAEKTKNEPARKSALDEQQKAIRDAAAALPVPADAKPAQAAKAEAAAKLEQVTEALEKGDLASAERRMSRAKDALDKLAQAMPSKEERTAKAQDELKKLQIQQESVTRESEQAARTSKDDPATPEGRKAMAQKTTEQTRKQGEIAERLARLDAPGQEERQQRAAQAAAEATDDLKKGRMADAPASQADTKRQMERLQQALAGQKPPDEKARELARRQSAAAQDAAKMDEPKKNAALQARQKQIAQEAKELVAPDVASAKEAAAEAAQRAAEAMTRKQPNAAAAAQEAAEKLEELARQLAGEGNAAKAERLAKQQEQMAREPAATPAQQKQASDRMQVEASQVKGGDNAAAEKKAAQEALKNAAQTNNPAAQVKAAEAMRKLADAVKGQPESKPAAQQAQQPPSESPQGQQAKQLAQKQRELRDRVAQAAGASSETPPASAEASAKAKADQAKLQERSKDLAKQLDQLAQSMQNQPGQSGSQEAAKSTDAAQQAMQKSQQSGSPEGAQSQRQQAAQQLQRAADMAKQAAQANGGEGQQPPSQAGQSMQQAQQAMQQAQQQLGQGEPGQAKQSMQQAGQQLAQAASQMSPSQGPDGGKPPEKGDPAMAGGQGQGTPDSSKFAQELKQHAGKPWGDLPGELRTKIIQEMKSQYGDDYARIIKLYFEQIADRKPPK